VFRNSIPKSAFKAISDEFFAMSIYTQIAKRFKGDPLGVKFDEIARMEGEHAVFWRTFFEKRGYAAPSQIGKLKISFYDAVLRILGRGLTLRLMEMNESDAVDLYSGIVEDRMLDGEEAEGLKKILEDELVHEQEFTREESRFEGFLAYVKDAVLGMNDGLVEILSVTTGLAGVYGNPFQVALGGLIVGIAGALSMGISTYASVRAQRQVQEGVLNRIVKTSRYVAHVFKERVAAHMLRKGYSERVSNAVAEESSKDHGMLSDFIAAEEHGLRKEALGKPLKAGLYAGLFNAFGAFVPLLPYLFSPSIPASVLMSLAFAGGALAFTGSLIAVLANMHVKKKMVEMVFAGLISAGATYLLGRAASLLLGVTAAY